MKGMKAAKKAASAIKDVVVPATAAGKAAGAAAKQLKNAGKQMKKAKPMKKSPKLLPPSKKKEMKTSDGKMYA